MVFSSVTHRLLFVMVVIWAFGGSVSQAAAGADDLVQLQQRAVALQLANSPGWQALLHYEPDRLGDGVTSTVASDWFFLAADGKHDPRAELFATLAAFFSATRMTPEARPARCALPARYDFLVSHLSIDTTRLPDVRCPDYKRWLAALDPASVTLAFPAAWPGSPASMFGHTLLRIDSQRSAATTDMLAHAVNFAANTGDDKGLRFAFNGLTGGYPGMYGVFPYYRQVKQYAWIENRDIWSYPLHLRADEIRRLAAHLWAMRNVHFRYYFLHDNCAYQLLALLDVARPSLELTRRFAWYTIPTDTIRALRDVPGLLGAAQYRPSMQAKLAWRGRQLDPAQRRLALMVAKGSLAPNAPRVRQLPARRRARVLDVAAGWLSYQRRRRGNMAEDVGTSRSHAILLARSHIDEAAGFAPVASPDTPPDRGHGTFRMGLDGRHEDGVFSLALHVRPAYHDLLDNPAGYIRGAKLDFLDLGVRLRLQTGALRVDHLTFADVMSIAPRTNLFKPLSWQVATGIRRRPSPFVFSSAPNNLGYYVQGGPGLAWGQGWLSGYVFALGALDANSALAPAYRASAGISAGLAAQSAAPQQWYAEVGYLHHLAGATGHYGWLRLGQQWQLTKQLGLRLTVGWTDTAIQDGSEVALGLRFYF